MGERYRPARINREFADLMVRARQVNQERDRVDKVAGMQVPRECGPAVYLSAAINAIECGVMVREWDSVAEGLIMLEDLKATYAVVLGSKKATSQETKEKYKVVLGDGKTVPRI